MTAVPATQSALARSAGTGWLSVDLVHGQSAAVAAGANPPLRVLVPRPRGMSVWAYLSSFGGGMVGGDETRVRVDVTGGARCYLGTQSSTKVYRSLPGLGCEAHLDASIGDGSLLVCTPDPVQCFANSAYTQVQRFQLAPSGGLVLLDWLSAGRHARGERWAFRSYSTRTEVECGGKRLLTDALSLTPEDGALDGIFRAGRFHCFATLIAAGGVVAPVAGRWVDWVNERPLERRAALRVAGNRVGDGAVIRVAAADCEAASAVILRLLEPLSAWLGDDPWRRKW